MPASFTGTGEDLAYLPASVQLELFHSRQLSPVDVLEAQIAQYEQHNDQVNAVTYTHFDKARTEARESEQRWRRGDPRPLEGITCALKDEHHEKGMTVTSGSVLFADQVMDDTDDVTAKLKDAGVVIHLQTTVPEFYVIGMTHSRLWGVTRNPWNLAYTVGGSSGGTGAVLASGMTTMGTGSDMGGSIRLPSAYCGLYGFKPPYGRISTEIPLAQYSGSGPLARTFTDMTLLLNAMSGPTPHAPMTLPKLTMPLTYDGLEGVRIAYSTDLGLLPVSAETRRITAQAVQRLRDHGATVDEVDLDLGTSIDELAAMFFRAFWAGSMGGSMQGLASRTDVMSPYAASVFAMLERSTFGGPDNAAFEQWMRALYGRVFDQLWGRGYHALVTPTLVDSHVPADFDPSLDAFEVDGLPVHRQFSAALTVAWNVLNSHPVVAVPAGLTERGMPVGVQIVAKPYDDETAFRIAHAYELATEPFFVTDVRPDYRRS